MTSDLITAAQQAREALRLINIGRRDDDVAALVDRLSAAIEAAEAEGWNYDLSAAPEGESVEVSWINEGTPAIIRTYRQKHGRFPGASTAYAWRSLPAPAPIPEGASLPITPRRCARCGMPSQTTLKEGLEQIEALDADIAEAMKGGGDD